MSTITNDKWLSRLDEWRNPDMWDEDTQPSEEAVLRQFLYSTISKFLSETAVGQSVLADFDDQELDRILDGWLDEDG